MSHQLKDPRGEYLKNYRCVDGWKDLNTSTKAVYVTQLSDALIIQLNIFKHIDGISKTFVPHLSINDWILLGDNRMVLSGVIYHENIPIADIIHTELRWIILVIWLVIQEFKDDRNCNVVQRMSVYLIY